MPPLPAVGAAAGAVPRPRRLVAQPLRRGLRRLRRRARLGLRGAALPRLQRRAQPRAARLPLGRLRGDRLDPGAHGLRERERGRGPDARGRRLAGRQRADALGRRSRREAARTVRAVAAVCAPLDLAAGGAAIGRGFNRLVYTRMFLRTMKPKALAKLAQHPGLFDREALMAARDLYSSTTCSPRRCTASANTDDYWRARLGQAAPAPHPHSRAGGQRAERPLRARPPACRARARSAARHAVAAGARRPCRLPARPPSGPRARHARGVVAG